MVYLKFLLVGIIHSVYQKIGSKISKGVCRVETFHLEKTFDLVETFRPVKTLCPIRIPSSGSILVEYLPNGKAIRVCLRVTREVDPGMKQV